MIRTATPSDAAGMSAVLTALTAANLRTARDDETFVLENYVAHVDNIQCSVAVDADDKILGLQVLKLATEGNIYGVTPGWGIIGTHISPDAARQGIGKALFAATLTAAQKAKLAHIDAYIGDNNQGGLAYYDAMGFQTYRTTQGRICKCFTLDGHQSVFLLPRKIDPSEQFAVATLWHDAWHETQAPFVPAELAAQRDQPDFLRRLVAMGDLARVIGPIGAPTGFCAILDDELDQLFISPQARGTGAGAILVKDAEDRLRASGINQAQLDCLKENTDAIRFYEKMGWTSQGLQPIALGTSTNAVIVDCIVFAKILTD